MSTSVSAPPTRSPNFPPEILSDPGALQPAPPDSLHEKKPFPYSPPTMNPPFLRFGITTTHCAFFSKSCGMPLSPACAIAVRASVAACNRSDAVFCANACPPNNPIRHSPDRSFISAPFLPCRSKWCSISRGSEEHRVLPAKLLPWRVLAISGILWNTRSDIRLSAWPYSFRGGRTAHLRHLPHRHRWPLLYHGLRWRLPLLRL